MIDLDTVARLVEAELYRRDGKRHGDNIRFRCVNPRHVDEHPSADYSVSRRAWLCRACGARGGLGRLRRRLEDRPPRPVPLPRPGDHRRTDDGRTPRLRRVERRLRLGFVGGKRPRSAAHQGALELSGEDGADAPSGRAS